MEEWPSGYGVRLESAWEQSLAGSSPVSSARVRIIFFNIWHGQAWNGLSGFLRKNLDSTDVFCLLEVDPDIQKKLEDLLSDFEPIYDKGIKTEYLDGVIEGRSVFVKKGIKVINKGKSNIFETTPRDAGGFQYAHLEVGSKKFFVGEVHGKTHPGDKTDTPERIDQSKKIIEFLEKVKEPKILGGDFNLMPDTKSIRMIEETGLTNLIKSYGIKSTRNRISWDQFSEEPGFTKQYFADYAFVSHEIKVTNFEVPYTEVSDHLPLILDFEV